MSTIPEIMHFLKGWQRSQGIDPDEKDLPEGIESAEELERRIRAIHKAKGHTDIFGKEG